MRLRSPALPSALLATAAAAFAQGVASPTLELARLQPGAKSRRVSSYDVTGGNADNVSKIASGTRRELSSVAYWYQQEPHEPFPPFPSRASRKPMPPITEVDILLWRDAWRKAHGSRPRLWGNEKEK